MTSTSTSTRPLPTCEPSANYVGPDVYGYARRASWRAVGSVTGADWEDTAHDLILALLEEGADCRTLSEPVRGALMWGAKSARRDAIRAASARGDEPSEGAASEGLMQGHVGPVAHWHDLVGAAWDLLAVRDPEAYRWAVVASYGVPKRGGLSTVHVVPFRDSRDRDGRALVIRRALDSLAACLDTVTERARANGVHWTDGAALAGAAKIRGGAPLVDVAHVVRAYGDTLGALVLTVTGADGTVSTVDRWSEVREDGAEVEGDYGADMVRAVTGALSPRDMAATFANTDGPAGSNVPARAPRVNTGAKGRTGALSGAPGRGTKSGGGHVAGAGRQRLATERPHREERAPVDRFALSGDVTAPVPLSPEAEARAEAEAERAEALARAARSTWRPEADTARDRARAEAERAARWAAEVLPNGMTRAAWAEHVRAHRAAWAAEAATV
jgi:hypothetical protein